MALAHAGRHFRHAVDAQRVLADANSVHEGRYLTIASTFQGGVAIQGHLDPEAGATAPTRSPTWPARSSTLARCPTVVASGRTSP